MPDTRQTNLHACAIILENSGLLIRGPSGSGKTSLALHLVDHAAARSVFAALVCDDQTLISIANDRVIARQPAPIAGMVEIRGLGLARQFSIQSAILHLVIDIVEPDRLERMPTEEKVEIGGISLPRLCVPRHRIEQATLQITRWLARN